MSEKKIFLDVQPEDELLPSEISVLESEVQKEIDRELKAAAKEKMREKIRDRERQKRGVAEPVEDVTIDLAPYCDRILLDNVVYYQGKTYTVRISVAQTMRETIQNTWRHQSIVDGKSENFYRRSRGIHVTPHGVVNSSQLLRA